MKFEISTGAQSVLRTLAGEGYEAYLVGGCVRDLLRGAAPHGWDICTSARPEEIRACFAGRRVVEAGLKHGTVAVMEDGGLYEVTACRAEGPYSDCRRPDYVRFVSSLEEDLARRDFTMNAMAMDLRGGLCDPFGGAEDVRNGRIRCVGEPGRRFREDGLRIMRALRFAAVLGYEIEERTARAVHENRAVLGRVAAERINAELCRLGQEAFFQLLAVKRAGAMAQGPEVGRVLEELLERVLADEVPNERQALLELIARRQAER